MPPQARSQTAPPPPAVPAPAGDESDLPEGWASVAVSDVTHPVSSISPENEPDREFRYVDISAICNESFRITETKQIKGAEAPSRARRPVQKADTLFSNVRTYLRNIAFVDGAVPADVCSTGFTVLRPNEAIEPQYLFRYSLSDAFIDAVSPHQTGTHYPATSDRVVLSQSLPLPPLAEQRRIVGVLEGLLGKVAASRERLARVPQLLKRFRQSVLAAACSGKLTTDWREENPDEPPYDQNLIKESLDDSDVPWNWGQTSLGPLIDLVTSGSRGWAEYYSDAGSVFIRAQNINRDVLDLEDIAFVQLPNKAEGLRTRVQQHDILITITGANVTKSALVEHQLDDAYVSQHVALVRLKDQRLAQFLFHWIVSVAHGRKQLQESAYGQGKPGLNLDNIRDVAVALPPLAEQHEIVRRVEQLFALADRLEAQLDAARKRVDRLTQAILAKAFRGELVPTEADLARREARPYEPAHELLARIRDQPTATKPTKAPRKPRQKTGE